MEAFCQKCTSPKVNKYTNLSIGSFLLMIIIPKCPFCVMTYTSAIAICGSKDLSLHENNWVSYLPLILGVFIFFVILINKKGKRTLWSLFLVVAGLLLIFGVHQHIIDQVFYTTGTFIMFFAIWLNGSFLSLIAQIRVLISHRGY